jgi:hypothetical protein
MRALLVLFALTSTAVAAPDISLSATTSGSHLALTFTNVSGHAIHLPVRIHAQEMMWDWLTVTLTKDGATRAMSFIHAREKSFPELVDLAPGKSTTETIDLVPWAFADGDPLAPGTYALDATWDTMHDSDGPKLKLTATATLTIAAPKDTDCHGSGTTGLALVGRQRPGTSSSRSASTTRARPRCASPRGSRPTGTRATGSRSRSTATRSTSTTPARSRRSSPPSCRRAPP